MAVATRQDGNGGGGGVGAEEPAQEPRSDDLQSYINRLTRAAC